jgi:phage gp16-like protein
VESITKNQIRYVQWLRRARGIDDETWREMVRSEGSESTRDLDQRQLDRLLSRLEERDGSASQPARRSWKPVHKSAKKSGMDTPPPMERAAMLSKVEAILSELKLPWSYADAMARRMFGKEKLRWLDAAQTYKLLQALTVYQRRLERKQLKEDLARQQKEAAHECAGGTGVPVQAGACAE